MKNKKRGSDETWLPQGPGQRILSSTPRGIPPLVRPGTKKLLPIKDLEACMKKCKCLAHEDRQRGPLLSLPRKHSVQNGKLLLPNFSVRIKEQSGTSTNCRGIARLRKPQQPTGTNATGGNPE